MYQVAKDPPSCSFRGRVGTRGESAIDPCIKPVSLPGSDSQPFRSRASKPEHTISLSLYPLCGTRCSQSTDCPRKSSLDPPIYPPTHRRRRTTDYSTDPCMPILVRVHNFCPRKLDANILLPNKRSGVEPRTVQTRPSVTLAHHGSCQEKS